MGSKSSVSTSVQTQKAALDNVHAPARAVDDCLSDALGAEDGTRVKDDAYEGDMPLSAPMAVHNECEADPTCRHELSYVEGGGHSPTRLC